MTREEIWLIARIALRVGPLTLQDIEWLCARRPRSLYFEQLSRLSVCA